ncbi:MULTISPECIES: beta-galactosidase [unclassified Pseudonocardia]|uniref:beta-galactosidase n=1 Tax=unclassified Pseudonocardia TaxID=2619320 RepID=UPI0001FFDE24|nr:beta-galactosidase [Pseudonocardia sp. Ae707_Ps1]OLM21216.1 Beta-galactosidase [Pseudonocardia sp. Ae707_Ps1]
MARWLRRTPGVTRPRIEFGADYNPEQWPRETWGSDIALMREAGVTVATVGVFSWARLQPAPDRWDFGWLDEVLDLLADGGIAVDLATATASPPPWLHHRHPEILPVDADGRTVWPGGRQHYRPTSPVFRRYALDLVRRMADRYGGHPALAAWHVSNELGCHNVHDHSSDAETAFRSWLRERYGDLDALNHAWGTSFWSQHYGDWAEIRTPRTVGPGTFPNPTQLLDFARFSSDALREHLRAEVAVLREVTPDVPVTTNFMVMGETSGMDYASWVPEIDIVSNDHYVVPGPDARDELSFSSNLTGNLAGGEPWWQMEHSTSAVNWQPVNRAKRPGELARDSLTHLAHGADAICYFQWRQSTAGAEKFHSAMVPHAGPDSAVFRDVTALGATLAELAPVAGAHRVPARAAILWDQPSWWAAEQPFTPTTELRYKAEALGWYRAFLDAGVRADVVPAGAGLAGYELVVAPVLHVVGPDRAAELAAFVDGGGHLVTTYFSGTVDESAHAVPGGYPGALRDLLGVRVEEFAPLDPGATVLLDDGGTGDLWSEPVQVVDPSVEVLARYTGAGTDPGAPDLAGLPAVTRRPAGRGSASYVSTRLADRAPLLGRLLRRAGIVPELPGELCGRVELVRREGFRFLVNRGDAPVDLTPLGEAETLAGLPPTVLPPRGATVLRD